MEEDTGFDRRSLLAGAGAAVAASAIGATPALAGDPHRKRGRGHGHHGGGRGGIPREQISIQLYTLRDLQPNDVDTMLKGLADIGYKTVEHAGFRGLSAADFRAALRKYGLKATSGHQEVPQPFDEAVWRQRVADAVTVGQRYIVTPISPIVSVVDGVVKGLSTVAAWKAYAADLNKAGMIARQSGLRLGFHNHYWEFAQLDDASPLVGFDILLTDTDPRLVHFELDLYWTWYAHRDPNHLLAYAGDRVRQFHVKDMKYNGTTPTFTDPGTGVIDFARIFKAAGNPREHEYIVERDDAGAAALQTAKVGFDYLSRVRF